MKTLFYRVYYFPPVNFVFRHIARGINDIFGTKIRFSISGRVPMHLTEGRKFYLEMNESSAAHVYFWERAMNFEFTPIFVELARRMQVFLDIGSNIGFYTGVANAVNPNVKVWAFEPAEGPHEYLCRNKQHNQWRNTEIVRVALSDQIGSINFFEGIRPKYRYLRYHLSGIGATQNSHNLANMIQYTVPTDTLDHFAAANQIPHIDVIKLDTEATEHLILEHGYERLQKDQPLLICEVIYGKVEVEVERHIKALGFHIFQQIGQTLVPRTTLREVSNDEERNFFFVPESKLPWVEQFIVRKS